MLDLLVRYAYDHGLESEPGFKPKDARWAASFAADGRYIGILDFGRDGRVFPKSPDLSQPELKFLGRKPKGAGKDEKAYGSHFLIAECENVVLLATKPGEAAGQAAQIKHNAFVDLLRRASEIVPEFALLASQLSDPETLKAIQADLVEKKARSLDKMTVQIDGRFIADEDTWHDWWRGFRADIARRKFADTEASEEMVCLATGEIIAPHPTHPLVSGMDKVGGRSQSSFIGFDKDAFRSFGLRQAENAAVSEQAASAYRSALNSLIKKGEVFAGMCVAYWFSHDIELDDDVLSWLTSASQEQSELTARQRARDLLQAIRSGQRADLAQSRYYALSLSGASARIMTRDWMEGAFEDLVASIEQWFADLEIVNYLGTNAAKLPGLERVITCLLPPRPQKQDEKEWLKPVGSSRIALWKAALNPEMPIPFSVIGRLVPLHRAFVLSGKMALVEGPENPKHKRDQVAAISLVQTRMSLIKSYHNRLAKGEHHMQPYLNEDHPAKAYHCGRLMSILASLQQAALGDVGAGVVQRYYGAASTTPALVLGRLTRLSKHHLNRLDNPKLAFWYEDKLASVWGRLKDTLPPTLNLEEQSLFALGYYQQMAHDRTKKPSDQKTTGDTHA